MSRRKTVKGINFKDLREVGDPVEMGIRYAAQGADELVYLDISATTEGRGTFMKLVSRIAKNINIPFTVGGGIRTKDQAAALLLAGADKISVNSAAVENPKSLHQLHLNTVHSLLLLLLMLFTQKGFGGCNSQWNKNHDSAAF